MSLLSIGSHAHNHKQKTAKGRGVRSRQEEREIDQNLSKIMRAAGVCKEGSHWYLILEASRLFIEAVVADVAAVGAADVVLFDFTCCALADISGFFFRSRVSGGIRAGLSKPQPSQCSEGPMGRKLEQFRKPAGKN